MFCIICWYYNIHFLKQFAGLVLQMGYAVHEIGHALGLLHEHQRPDRDDHVYINEENIYDQDTIDRNFQRHVEHVSDFGLPYDYASIMQYPSSVSTLCSIHCL